MIMLVFQALLIKRKTAYNKCIFIAFDDEISKKVSDITGR